jgi:hypothetical protein
VLVQPPHKVVTIRFSSSEIEHHTFLCINAGLDLMVSEEQEYFHRGVTDAFVAVEERMVGYERKAERCGFIDEGWMQVQGIRR